MTKITSCVVGVVVAALALSACATSAPNSNLAVSPATTVPSDGFLCNGSPVSRNAEETRLPLSEMSESGRTALSNAVWDDSMPLDLPSEEDWYLGSESDDRVVILREIEVGEESVIPGLVQDREKLSVNWVDDATNLEPGWYVSESGQCALTLDLNGASVPVIEMRSAPAPESLELNLLVTEQECNSGEDAEGRIEVVSISETDAQVSLVLGVQPRGGAQTCPANPATPFTVTLDEPLGEREVVDAGRADPLTLWVND